MKLWRSISYSSAVMSTVLGAFAQVDDAPSTAPTSTGHWPKWRGPLRDNVSTETGLLQQWPEGGPPLIWKVEGLGEGIASIAVAGGSIYTAGFSNSDVVTLYLTPEVVGRLVPQLKKLESGARIVAHEHPIPGIRPARVVRVVSAEDNREHTIYLWTAHSFRQNARCWVSGGDRVI